MSELRISLALLALLRVLAERRGVPTYGYDLMKQTELKSGTLYPILTRLERHGFLHSDWESINPSAAGRPARRIYTLTPDGQRFAEQELAKAQRAVGGQFSHA